MYDHRLYYSCKLLRSLLAMHHSFEVTRFSKLCYRSQYMVVNRHDQEKQPMLDG